jgi:hypothetical protein
MRAVKRVRGVGAINASILTSSVSAAAGINIANSCIDVTAISAAGLSKNDKEITRLTACLVPATR